MADRSMVHGMNHQSSSSGYRSSSRHRTSSTSTRRIRDNTTDNNDEAIWKRTFARSGTPASERMERSRSRSRHGETKGATTSSSSTSIRRQSPTDDIDGGGAFDRRNSMNSTVSSSTTRSNFQEEKHSLTTTTSSKSKSAVSNRYSNSRGRMADPSATSQYYSPRSKSQSRGSDPTSSDVSDNMRTPSAAARSKSRTRTMEPASSPSNNDTTARSTTPLPSKKLGCLGGSTDMTRRGKSQERSRGGGTITTSSNNNNNSTAIVERTSSNNPNNNNNNNNSRHYSQSTESDTTGGLQGGVKEFERQMRNMRRSTQNERMKNMDYGRVNSRGNNESRMTPSTRMQGHQFNQQQKVQGSSDGRGGQSSSSRGRSSSNTRSSSSRGRSRGRSQGRPMTIDAKLQQHEQQEQTRSSRSKSRKEEQQEMINRHHRQSHGKETPQGSQGRPMTIDAKLKQHEQQQQQQQQSRWPSRSKSRKEEQQEMISLYRQSSLGKEAPSDPSPRKHRSKSRDPSSSTSRYNRGRSKSKGRSTMQNHDDDDDDVKSLKSLRSLSRRRRSSSKGRDSKSVYSSSRSVAASGTSVISRASAKLSGLSGGRSVISGRSAFSSSVISGKSAFSSDESEKSSTTPSTGPLSSYNSHPSPKFPQQQQQQTPQQQRPRSRSRSRPATPNRTPEGNLHNADVKPDIDEKEIMTYLFDRRGFCVRHPHVRLRKKKMLGGWQTIITNCPECCMAEMNRLKRLRKKKKKAKKDKGTKSTMSEKQKYRRRSSSPSRSRKGNDAFDDAKSLRSSRSKSSRRSKSTSKKKQVQEQYSSPQGAIFEFDIPVGEQPPLMSSSRSVKSGKSRRSTTSRKSAKSTRSTRTNKSSRTTKSSRSKSRPKNKKSDGSAGGKAEVSRGSARGSQQRFIRKGGALRVTKMTYTDVYGREGKYTGDINEYGLPHGTGTMRYNNGTLYEGDDWVEGHSQKMDLGGALAQHGFSDWKSNTKLAKAEREKKKEREMDDLRSFISQSVRSGMTHSTGTPGPQMQPTGPKEQVHEMPWSDVNGYSGHYTGEVNGQEIPDGRGFMQYNNGVVEDGFFVNGVFQPPMPGMLLPQQHMDGNQVPSSSMSVWSLKSTPTMAQPTQGNVMIMPPHQGNPNGNAGAMGAPMPVNMSSPSNAYGGQDPYANIQNRYS